MSDSIVALIIDNKKYTGWESVSVSKSMDALCGSFEIGLVNSVVTKSISPGMACKVLIDNEPVITGYIDKRSRTIEPNSKTMTFSGRDKTRDLVDCSATKTSGSWTKTSLRTLCEDICKPFGIKVIVDKDVDASKTFKSITIQDGESAFTLIDRLCRLRAILPLSTSDGDLFLTTTGKAHANDDLIAGINIKSITEDLDYSNRFSDYTVKSQDSGEGAGWTKKSVTGIRGTAFDNVIKNVLKQYRPLIIQSENKSDATTAKKRAEWEAIVRFSRSLALTVGVAGWKQTNGSLWQRNSLVSLQYDELDLRGTFLISGTKFTINNSGRNTSLQVNHQNAFVPEPTVAVEKSKSAKNPWK